MISRILFFLILSCCFISCKLVPSGNTKRVELSTEPLIGTVGSLSRNVVSNQFSQVGVPRLQEKIRLTANYKLFTKSKLRKYNALVDDEEQELRIVDSLDLRPGYFTLDLGDKIGYLTALNQPENAGLKKYLEETKNNQVLTGIDIYFPPETADLIQNAIEVYLINNLKSVYSLELLNKDKTTTILNFNEGTSFGYHFRSLCWSENYRHKADIAAFRKMNSSCPGNTRKNPDRIYSKDIFDKLN